MIRRPLWLAAGAALGAGGTLWVQRRVERLTRRVRPTSVANELAAAVDRTRRQTTTRVRDAIDTGRFDARQREDELWRDLTARNHTAH